MGYHISMEMLLLYGIRGGVILVLLMPLLVTGDTLFPFIVGKAVYSRALIEIVFGLWVALAYRYPSHRLPRSWILIAFGIYLGVAALAGVFGVSTQRSLWSTYERMQGVIDLAHWFALAVVLISVFRPLSHWRALLNINLGVSLVLALLGLAQHYDVSIPGFGFLDPTERLDITLGNPTYVGSYMMVNLLIALGFLSQSYQNRAERRVSPPSTRRRRRRRRQRVTRDWRPFWWRVFWITVIGLDFWTLWQTGSRGALIALVSGLMVFVFLYLIWGTSKTGKRLGYTFVGVVVGLGLLIGFGGNTAIYERVAESNVMFRQFGKIGLTEKSIKGRWTSLSAGFEGFAARPALGWGPENYMIAWGRYFDSASGVTERFDQAHNKLVEEMTTKGIIGLLSYLAVWGLMVKVLHRRIKEGNPDQQLLTMSVGAALTGYFVQNLFLFDTPATFLQFIILLGFIASVEVTSAESEVEPSISRAEPTPANSDGGRAAWLDKLRTLGDANLVGRAKTPRYVFTAALALGFLAIYSSLAIFLIINYKTYDAAQAVVRAANPSIEWDESLGLFDRSINSFRPLANYPRLLMFNKLSGAFGELAMGQNKNALTVGQAREALAMAEVEARRAINTEPQGWRMYVGLGYLYQNVALLEPANLDTSVYLEKSRSYVDKAAELAPDTLEVGHLLERQQATEVRYQKLQKEAASE